MQCMVLRCRRRIREDRLMCTKHWNMVPKPMQERVTHYWLRPLDRPPAGTGSTEWFAAVDDAVFAVDAKEEQRAYR